MKYFGLRAKIVGVFVGLYGLFFILLLGWIVDHTQSDFLAEIDESLHQSVNEITEARLTLDQILSDKMDYKALALKSEDKKERITLYNKHLLKVSCANLLTECRNAWEMIIGT